VQSEEKPEVEPEVEFEEERFVITYSEPVEDLSN
jgi:hypothetical protein